MPHPTPEERHHLLEDSADNSVQETARRAFKSGESQAPFNGTWDVGWAILGGIGFTAINPF